MRTPTDWIRRVVSGADGPLSAKGHCSAGISTSASRAGRLSLRGIISPQPGGNQTQRTRTSAAATSEDGSTPSQPKSVSITLALKATDPSDEPGSEMAAMQRQVAKNSTVSSTAGS